jgi:hypothetical protein
VPIRRKYTRALTFENDKVLASMTAAPTLDTAVWREEWFGPSAARCVGVGVRVCGCGCGCGCGGGLGFRV